MPYCLAVNYQNIENEKSIAVLKEIRELTSNEMQAYNDAIFAVRSP